MASVFAVTSAEFRPNLVPQPNVALEGEDPFSLLLNTVADAKATVQRPEAPQVAGRRNDVPAKQPKPEADTDRQAKRQPKDAAKPDTKPDPRPQAETAASSTKEPAVDGTGEKSDGEGEDSAAVDALLAIALGEASQQAVAGTQVNADPNTASQIGTALVVAAHVELEAEVQATPALMTANVTAATSAEMVPVPQVQQVPQVAQSVAATKPKLEFAPAIAQSEAEAAFSRISAETVSSLVKPLRTISSFDTQVQMQPGAVNLAAATPLQGPAPLELLNAAISKHVQLAQGFSANEAAPDVPKPQIASNAVAPNFAMTVQVNAPVPAQTQTAAESARAVPMDQLAVEIATRAGKGERRFDIRLDPPELGRIDVRLEIDHKGNTTTKLIVERAETLDMLQRDARGLEKALQNAGLKTDAGGMQFSLQQDAQTHQGQEKHAPEMRDGRPDLVQGETDAMAQVSINDISLAAQLRGGVDIRI